MRTARERAILAGVVFMVLLALVAGVAVWRTQDIQERHHSLERRAAAVASLEHAHVQFVEGQAAIAALVWTQDPSLAEIYREYAAALEHDLSLARAETLAQGDADHAAALDNLIERIGWFDEELKLGIPIVLEAGPEEAVRMASATRAEKAPEADAIRADLRGLIQDAEDELAAERAAADRAADVTLWLLIGFSAAAFVVGAAAVAMLAVSVARPLASLQASARAVASGDLEARATVSGPEEVASLARDFNQMVAERKRAEEALRQAHNELEMRVKERTADLISANERLQREVAERKQAEEALRESEAKYRRIFENVWDIYYQTDAQGIITEISPSVERWGYIREELIGTQVLDVYEDPEERSALLQALLEQGEVLDYEIHLKTGDGRVVDTSVGAHLLRGPDGTFIGVEGILRDISERKRAEEALREQVLRDQLTGVLNHAGIVAELRDLISDGGDGASHAVAMIDVDDLKVINDTYGHQVGDAVLVEAARALSRDGAIVGRYGGDEFVAILPGADRDAGERYRDAVLDTLAGVRLTDAETGASVPVVVSVGLATYPTEAGRIEELIKLADSEMFTSKRQRPVGSAGLAPSRLLGSKRAAEIVGELVPLLTSAGDLDEKLRLVAHRLSVQAGYEGVTFSLYAAPDQPPRAQNTFAQAPEDLIEAWKHDNRSDQPHPIRPVLEARRRPIMLGDPDKSDLLRQHERELLRAAGLRSALVAPMIWEGEVVGLLGVASKRERAFGPRDASFLMIVATQVTAIARMARLVEELQSASARLTEGQAETVMLLAAAAEAHDRTSGHHLQSVRAITEALAAELGYNEEDAKGLGLAAVLHDIGKIRVPDSILANVGRLGEEEWDLMKHHTAWGGEFLAGRPGFELAAAIARSHHEHWDGSGYPDGLSGEVIPETAAIVAVADAFDAMTSDRPYRPCRTVAQAVREIVVCSGKQFSPRVVQALVRLHKGKQLPLVDTEDSGRKAVA